MVDGTLTGFEMFWIFVEASELYLVDELDGWDGGKFIFWPWFWHIPSADVDENFTLFPSLKPNNLQASYPNSSRFANSIKYLLFRHSRIHFTPFFREREGLDWTLLNIFSPSPLRLKTDYKSKKPQTESNSTFFWVFNRYLPKHNFIRELFLCANVIPDNVFSGAWSW